MAQRNLKSITFEGLPIKYLIPTTGVVDLGEDPNFYDSLDTLVEEGTYKVSDGDFAYIIKIERPSENTVGQTYWSTEEGMTALYTRTGWFDGESWSFNEWDAPLYSGNAYSIFSDKQHVHYLMKTTDNFEEWIDNYTPGNFRVLDSTTEKYYYVSAEGYSVALNGRLRRYQSYFEVTEPWKVYSRAGTSTVGNSGYITWDAWRCVDDSLPTPEDIGATPAIEDATYSGCYYRMIDDEKEWLNPPMVFDTEYRTTERYNGNPVYVKLIDGGTSEDGKVINYNVTRDRIIDIKVTIASAPIIQRAAGEVATSSGYYASYYVTANSVTLICNASMVGSPCHVFVKYIK